MLVCSLIHYPSPPSSLIRTETERRLNYLFVSVQVRNRQTLRLGKVTHIVLLIGGEAINNVSVTLSFTLSLLQCPSLKHVVVSGIAGSSVEVCAVL